MRDKTKIHQKAREAIQGGKVPNRCPQRVWGGPGSGACCAVCGDAVTQNEFEMELEFARGDGDSGVIEYLFHVSCFTAWDSERCNFNGMARGTMVGSGRTHLARSQIPPVANGAPTSDPRTTLGSHGLPAVSTDPKIDACGCDTKSNSGPGTA
jgi:hypothetical protein